MITRLDIDTLLIPVRALKIQNEITPAEHPNGQIGLNEIRLQISCLRYVKK